MNSGNESLIDFVGTWLKKRERFMLYLLLQLILMAALKIILAYI